MTILVKRPELAELVDPDAPIERLATGFLFTEGPIWHPREKHLLFSDLLGDVRRRWDAKGGAVEIKRPSNKCNGMTFDADLNLLGCEHSTSMLVREYAEGRREIVASHFEGLELNSPNDVCVRSDGSIYFSDPWYGRTEKYGLERPCQLGFQAIYRVSPNGALELLVEKDLFEQPNGLCFSPDEAILYVADTTKALIRAFDVRPDGSLTRDRVFASGLQLEGEPGRPDGMKCDARGNLWATGPSGVWVFTPDGALLGRLRLPEQTANINWGGADFRTLFLTASTSLYAVQTKVGPRVEPYMRSLKA